MDLSDFVQLRLRSQLEILEQEAESLADTFDPARCRHLLRMFELLHLRDTTDAAGALQLVSELGNGGSNLTQEQARLLPRFVRAIRKSVCMELVGVNWATAA